MTKDDCLAVADIALFLDLDGTLAPFRAHPAEVGPEPGRTAVLDRAGERLDGRLAIVSGRTVAEIDRILEGVCPAVAGVHGLERRSASGAWWRAPPHPDVQDAVEAMTALAQAQPGLMVEPKGLSVALHYRGAPQAEAAVLEFADRLSAAGELDLQHGDKVVELKSPGMNKGEAIRAFLAEAPFAGATPVYVGDDLTDEDGFAAVSSLGGLGVLVGPTRTTAAQARLDDPQAVLAWLAAGLDTGAFDLGGLRWDV